MEITGKRGKCWRNLKNSKSESRNMWLVCGCKVRDGDFWKDIWVSILYRYLFSSILPITNTKCRNKCATSLFWPCTTRARCSRERASVRVFLANLCIIDPSRSLQKTPSMVPTLVSVVPLSLEACPHRIEISPISIDLKFYGKQWCICDNFFKKSGKIENCGVFQLSEESIRVGTSY